MKYIKKVEDKLSNTTVFRYVLGGILLIAETFKKLIMSVIKHITGLLMFFSLIGMVAAANAFENNAINYTTAILFILILGVLIATLIKIKILESKNK